MAKIDTLFMTKAAAKLYPLASHIPQIAHIREYPPPPGLEFCSARIPSRHFFCLS